MIQVFNRPVQKGFKFFFQVFLMVNQYKGIRTRTRCAFNRHVERVTIFRKVYERVVVCSVKDGTNLGTNLVLGASFPE